MGAYLIDRPWYVLAVVRGVVGGLLFGLLSLADDSPGRAAARGVFFGLFMGLVLGRRSARRAEVVRGVIGPLATEQARAACKAASRGPVPADPEVRGAALRLTRWRLDEYARQRTLSLIVWPAFIALSVLLVFTDGLGYLGYVAFFSLMWALWPFAQSRLRRRVQLLSG